MKLFAFILASFFIFQASTPVLCFAGCDDTMVKHLRDTELAQCEMSGCCSGDKKMSCEASLTSADAKQESQVPCADGKNCCTPCCAAPLITCFYEESAIVIHPPRPVTVTGELPSSNGMPHAGFRADCFQPPESIG